MYKRTSSDIPAGVSAIISFFLARTVTRNATLMNDHAQYTGRPPQTHEIFLQIEASIQRQSGQTAKMLHATFIEFQVGIGDD